jgi:putative endonuclease
MQHISKTLSSLAPPRYRFGTSKMGIAERGTCFYCFMREYLFFVYIMASKSRVLYTGITNDLNVRVFQHKIGRFDGFTKKYRVHRLVYFESYRYVSSAIAREKEIKHWTRRRRVELIESMNPTWEDLAASWFDEELLANPNGPAVMKYDPSKRQTFGNSRTELIVKSRELEQPIRMKFRPSQIRTFGDGKDAPKGKAGPPLRNPKLGS